MNKTELTYSEMMVMNIIWNAARPMTMTEILGELKQKFEVTWQAQPLVTYLRRLQEKGFWEFYREGRQHIYYAVKEKQDYYEQEALRLSKLWMASAEDSVAALGKMGQIDEEEKERSKKLLEEL